MNKQLRLRDLINVDYTDGDTPEDDLGTIPYQYVKRHRGQIGEDSLHKLHMDSWYEIEDYDKKIAKELADIAFDSKNGSLSGADKIKLDNIIQKVHDVKMQKTIRTFINTLESVVYSTDKQINESILFRRNRRFERTLS